MEPLIPDSTYCIFKAHIVGSRQSKIVLVELREIEDIETGGKYTIKRYMSNKNIKEDGMWEHERIELAPLNKAYQAISLNSNAENAFKIIAEFVAVLK